MTIAVIINIISTNFSGVRIDSRIVIIAITRSNRAWGTRSCSCIYSVSIAISIRVYWILFQILIDLIITVVIDVVTYFNFSWVDGWIQIITISTCCCITQSRIQTIVQYWGGSVSIQIRVGVVINESQAFINLTITVVINIVTYFSLTWINQCIVVIAICVVIDSSSWCCTCFNCYCIDVSVSVTIGVGVIHRLHSFVNTAITIIIYFITYFNCTRLD